MTIKVTLEFVSVDETIVALGKLVGTAATPVAAAIAEVKAARRGRADKGHKRGEYKPRELNAAPQVQGSKPGPGALTGTPSSESPAVAAPVQPAAPATEALPAVEPKPVAAAPSATIGEKDAEAQKAMELLHGKKGLDACRVLLGQFGVSRIREIPTARRSEFLEEAKQAAA